MYLFFTRVTIIKEDQKFDLSYWITVSFCHSFDLLIYYCTSPSQRHLWPFRHCELKQSGGYEGVSVFRQLHVRSDESDVFRAGKHLDKSKRSWGSNLLTQLDGSNFPSWANRKAELFEAVCVVSVWCGDYGWVCSWCLSSLADLQWLLKSHLL